MGLLLSVERADKGRDSIGEADGKDNDQREHIVDKRRRRQFFRTVMPDHKCVGKVQNKISQLPDDDGNT